MRFEEQGQPRSEHGEKDLQKSHVYLDKPLLR
jgi:hypothetical protein